MMIALSSGMNLNQATLAKSVWKFLCLLIVPLLVLLPWRAGGQEADPGDDRPRVRNLIAKVARGARVEAIATAVLAESRRFGFDPLLLIAVIEHESGFRTRMRGRHGEIGLMQLKPSTARWIARKSGIAWKGARSLEDPGTNVRLGTAYLAFLRERFSRQGHYLTAYNMGPGLAFRVLKRNPSPGGYPRSVLRRYHRFHAQLAAGMA